MAYARRSSRARRPRTPEAQTFAYFFEGVMDVVRGRYTPGAPSVSGAENVLSYLNNEAGAIEPHTLNNAARKRGQRYALFMRSVYLQAQDIEAQQGSDIHYLQQYSASAIGHQWLTGETYSATDIAADVPDAIGGSVDAALEWLF